MQKHLAIISAALALSTLAPPTVAQQVTAVPKLDYNTLTGSWYEIAHMPTKHETKMCKSDEVEVIALGEKNQLQLVDSCVSPKGYADASNRTAKQNKTKDGRLKTGFFPFTTKYWIIAQGAQNEWFLAGNPNHKTLYIYSKTPTLPAETLNQIEAKASSENFAVSKLVTTQQ